MLSVRAPSLLLRAAKDTGRAYTTALVLSLILVFLVPWWLRWCFFYLSGVVVLTIVIGPYVEDWKWKSRVAAGGKAVFISGCDTGFGHQLAQRLDKLGLHVFAGCLFPDAEGASSLKKSASDKLEIVPLDVLSDQSIADACRYVSENLKDNKLWAVVNNAGIDEGGEILWTNVDVIQRVIDVNCLGTIKVTKAFLPLLIKGEGRVITMASAAGRFTLFGMVPYCISKHATISFNDGLRMEMYRFGVKVVTIEPFMYRSTLTSNDFLEEMLSKTWNRAPAEIKSFYPDNYFEKYVPACRKFISPFISNRPQEVVACMEQAVMSTNPKYYYNPGLRKIRLYFWFMKWIPRPVIDIFCLGRFSLKTRNVGLMKKHDETVASG